MTRTMGDATPAEAAWHVYRKSDAAYEARPAFDAGYEAGAARAAAAERKRCLAVLADHYLAFMDCDHEGKRDQAQCACSLVNLGWHATVGEAAQSWIRHVADLLAARDTP